MLLAVLFMILYVTDLLVTIYIISRGYLDLAHLTFIPLIGEDGYFMLRFALIPFLLYFAKDYRKDGVVLKCLTMLTAYYSFLLLWNFYHVFLAPALTGQA